MALKRRTGTSKSPPILSHEFIIQNHADIVSCVAMLIVIGLLFQATSSIATTFVALQHNSSEPIATPLGTLISYTTGPKDLAIIFFYFLIAIVIHAVVQEYLLDKINRKLHLSKTKHSKFNESGQLLTFIAISLLWAGEIIRREGYYLPLSRLWTDYPARHVDMSYLTKFYFIIQIAYWAHQFPELYFQKVKRDEVSPRLTYAALYLVFFTGAYLFNFSKIAVVFSFLHYTAEALFHVSRLLYFSNKTKVYKYTFNAWNVYFPLIRLATIVLTVLTFWYGLAERSTSVATINLAEGNFNTPLIRITTLSALILLQMWMILNFATFHTNRWNEKANEAARRKKNLAAKAAAAKKAAEEEELSDLPEADQQAQPSPVVEKKAKPAAAKNNKLKVK